MAVAATSTVVLRGVSGQLVRVEADLSTGLPTLAFTGLAGTSITEARDRVRSAIVNAGIGWPNRRITVALLPADLRKSGSHLDLALALAVLAAAEEISAPVELETTVWLAELGLDGALRPVRGVLPAVLAARDAGIGRVVVAHANGAEAALVEGVEVRTAAHLAQVLASLGTGAAEALPLAVRAPGRRPRCAGPTWPTSRGSRSPATPWRSRRRAVTTCSCRACRVRARRCWPSGCPACCHHWATGPHSS